MLNQELWIWAVKPGLNADETRQQLEAARRAYHKRFGVAAPERPDETRACGRGNMAKVHWCYLLPGDVAEDVDQEQLPLFGGSK